MVFSSWRDVRYFFPMWSCIFLRCWSQTLFGLVYPHRFIVFDSINFYVRQFFNFRKVLVWFEYESMSVYDSDDFTKAWFMVKTSPVGLHLLNFRWKYFTLQPRFENKFLKWQRLIGFTPNLIEIAMGILWQWMHWRVS